MKRLFNLNGGSYGPQESTLDFPWLPPPRPGSEVLCRSMIRRASSAKRLVEYLVDGTGTLNYPDSNIAGTTGKIKHENPINSFFPMDFGRKKTPPKNTSSRSNSFSRACGRCPSPISLVPTLESFPNRPLLRPRSLEPLPRRIDGH